MDCPRYAAQRTKMITTLADLLSLKSLKSEHIVNILLHGTTDLDLQFNMYVNICHREQKQSLIIVFKQ